MTSAQRKQIANLLSEHLHPDKLIFRKNGQVVLRFGYFYRHGCTTEKYQQAVCQVFPAARFVADQCFDRWAPWPRDSYFQITFTVPEATCTPS